MKTPRKGSSMDHHNVYTQWRASLRAALAAVIGTLLLGGPGFSTAADEIRIGGTGAGLGTMQALAEAFMKQNPDAKVTVLPSLGTSGGIKAAIQGATDIAVAARPLKDDERKQGLVAFEYGRTPFVMAVASKTNASAITLAQLADIYAGKMNNWPDGTRIRIVLRPAGDAETDLIKSLSPEIRQALSEAEKRPGVIFAVTDQDAADSLEKIPGAIGPTSLALITYEKRGIKALKLGNVEPTLKNLAAGSYSYQKHLYLVTRSKPSAAAQRFVTFVQSGAGREILSRAYALP